MQLALKDLRPLSELAKVVPPRRRGRPVHLATMHRWRTVGLRGHRLSCIRAGGIWCSSEAALIEFFTNMSTPAPSTRPSTDGAPFDSQLAEHGW